MSGTITPLTWAIGSGIGFLLAVGIIATIDDARQEIACRIARHRRRRHLAGAVAGVAGRHQQPPLGCLVVHPALTEYLAWRDGTCQWCRTEGPDTITRHDCTCTAECGELWCSRKPRATEIPASGDPCGWCENNGAGWGCSCPAMCDSPFCMPGVAR